MACATHSSCTAGPWLSRLPASCVPCSVRWGVCCAFRCWSGTGLDRRVLGMLVNLVDTSLDVSKLKIYFTGRTAGLRALAAAFNAGDQPLQGSTDPTVWHLLGLHQLHQHF